MRVSYNRPTGITWAIAGTGASFITDATALTNGRPADATRIQWLSTGSPSITDTVTLTATLNTTIKAGCAALLLPNIATAIPTGVKITFSGKLSGGAVVLGGDAITNRTVTLPNGATAIFAVFPAVNIDKLIITIYNDQNGSTWATASEYVDLGEVWVGSVADFDVANDLEIQYQGGLLQRQSHNNQQWPLMVQPYRSVPVNVVPMEESVAIGPNSYQDDFETVAYALSTQATSVIILGYMLPGYDATANGRPPASITSSTINEQRLARTFVLGCPDQAIKMTRNGDRFFVSPITFGESPP